MLDIVDTGVEQAKHVAVHGYVAAKERCMSEQDLTNIHILVVGDVMLDRYWFGDVSRISTEAPVPVVRVTRVEERPGGAANVARNCASLGAHTQLLSVIGEDDAGARLMQLLESAGVCANLHRDGSSPTTVKLRVIGRQQQLLRIDFETQPSSEVLTSKLANFEAALPSCDVLVLSDYGKGGLAHIANMIGYARGAGKLVLVDPKGDDYTRYLGANIVTPNSAELREVVGSWQDEADLAMRAQRLRTDLDLDALLLTRGEQGMTLFDAHGAMHVPAEAREVYDVSGAGDTVIAALAVTLASGGTIAEAARVATRAAGIVVGKLGTAVVTRQELFGLQR